MPVTTTQLLRTGFSFFDNAIDQMVDELAEIFRLAEVAIDRNIDAEFFLDRHQDHHDVDGLNAQALKRGIGLECRTVDHAFGDEHIDNLIFDFAAVCVALIQGCTFE